MESILFCSRFSLDSIMSSAEQKAAKPAFVPKYEIATGLHKGRKLEKYVPKHVRPTRRTNVKQRRFSLFSSKQIRLFCLLEKKQTRQICS